MSGDGSVATLIEERPDLEAPLATILSVDAEHETWTFDDVPIDSGPFGELVSRDVVESVGEEYRLADPAATRRALDREGESSGSGDAAERGVSPEFDFDTVGLPALDRTTAGLIAAVVAIVAVVRVHPFASVYRNGDIVLSGNDPYAYRYYVEQVAGASDGLLDFGALGALSGGMQNGEPLLVGTLWWIAELFGGSVGAIGNVMAWYPVVSGVITAGFVYLIAVELTADRRVGLAAVLLFAIIPGHALRTSLGFADHHAFDYVWLAGGALALVSLSGTRWADLRGGRTWLVSLGLGVAVAGQVLAWDAGPLLLAPIGLAVLASSVVAIRDERSPLPEGVPIVAGLAFGTVLSAAVHLVASWQTDVVAYAPGLLLAGVVVLLALAEGIRRTTGDDRHFLASSVALAIGGMLAIMVVLPPVWATFTGRLDALFRGDGIAETASLFSFETFGFFLLLGFTLVLALPAMVWAVAVARERADWGITAAYAWYFLALAGLQVRFVGELATFAAVFAGVGFVWVAAWIDAVPEIEVGRRMLDPLRLPSRRTMLTLALLFLLVGSLGMLQVGIKTSQVTIDGDTYQSVSFIEAQSAERGQQYPENYVLSQWGDSRFYNYFVNGQSAGYGYAFNNYDEFVRSADPDRWYGQFEGRVGYIVMSTTPVNSSPETAIYKLTHEFGSGSEDADGVGHFRALYRAPGETRTVFSVVPGATIEGTAESNATVTVETNVEIPNAEFDYVRETTANASGDWSLRVANPGTYTVSGGGVNGTVEVTKAAVRSGEQVAANSN